MEKVLRQKKGPGEEQRWMLDIGKNEAFAIRNHEKL